MGIAIGWVIYGMWIRGKKKKRERRWRSENKKKNNEEEGELAYDPESSETHMLTSVQTFDGNYQFIIR